MERTVTGEEGMTLGYDEPASAVSPRAREQRIEWLDSALICLFLSGLYTNYTIMITAKVPFPSVPSGIAGVLLLWRRREMIGGRALMGFLAVVSAYLISILCATDMHFLGRRLNGLIQITYSIAIGYGLFLTVISAERRQIARLFLIVALIILAGCLLEDYAGLRPISDAVRKAIYRAGVYENDLRDLLFYHRVRPKFFASEPASVTFCYSLFAFLWMVTSRWKWKLFLYVALVGVGLFAMPGPTLLLMVVLVLPYMLFLESRKAGRLNANRALGVVIVAALAVGVFFLMATTLFPARLAEIGAGNDPSFFYRVQGPAIAGVDILKTFPFAGAGLTGEPFAERSIVNAYLRSPAFSAGWQILTPATELVINYFWLHWIYLGAVLGTIVVVIWTLWLRRLGIPSPAFCWMAWAIMGQASGAYVGPTCWAVLFLTGAAAVLHQRVPEAQTRREEDLSPLPLFVRRPVPPRIAAPRPAPGLIVLTPEESGAAT